MPKPAKTKIKLDSDSFQTLLQEIYNDILSVQKKARSDMEERKGIPVASTTDAFQIGKVNNESLKIIDLAKSIAKSLGVDDIKFHKIAIKDGEKLHEDMLAKTELNFTYQVPNINLLQIRPQYTNKKYQDFKKYNGPEFNSELWVKEDIVELTELIKKGLSC
jgi:hypothetical protein